MSIGISVHAHPHPSPLPWREGEAIGVSRLFASSLCQRRNQVVRSENDDESDGFEFTCDGGSVLPLLGERAGVRAEQTTIIPS